MSKSLQGNKEIQPTDGYYNEKPEVKLLTLQNGLNKRDTAIRYNLGSLFY